MLKLPLLFVALSATGCFIIEPDPLPCADGPGCTPPGTPVDVVTITPNLDLLIVVDDSPSMIEKQNAFRAAFPTLVDKLARIDGGMPDLHLGVISPDMGTSAVGDGQPGPQVGIPGVGGCVARGKGGALQSGDATLGDGARFATVSRDGSTNFEGDLALAFGEMSSLGAGGCGFEQPFAAVSAALGGNVPENAGFSRASANLAVLVLSDEDDCTAEHTTLFGPDSEALGPVQSFRCFRFGVECAEDPATPGVKTDCGPAAASTLMASPDVLGEALLASKPDPRRVLFGGVVGTPAPVEVVMQTPPSGGVDQPVLAPACRFGIDSRLTADPAIRISALAEAFPGRSRLESICSDDLTGAVANLGDAIAQLMTDRCVPVGIAETDCFVDDLRDSDPEFLARLTPCSESSGVGASCFDFVEDRTCESGRRLQISRPIPPAGDEWSTLRCYR